jgi:murein L,D-transpeptidase YafK
MLFKRKDYRGALQRLEAVSSTRPATLGFATTKAEIYRAMGRPDLAIPYLKFATALMGNSSLRRELAEDYAENGEFTKAITEYEALLNTEVDPAWVRQQIVDLTRKKLLAAETLTRQGFNAAAGISRQPAALLLISACSRCAIVEKESQTLFLYRSTPSGFEIERTFACSTGAQGGEKLEQGDERTPEGIYLLRRSLSRTQLPEIYGNMAITLDYPNAFDRLEGKSGDGIWLHATNESIRAYLPNKTRGCVVVSNEDIQELSNLITLNQTPLIIVPRIRYQTEAESRFELETLKSFLSDWRTYWENQELEKYMSLYSIRFRSGNQNFIDWKAHKEGAFARAGKIHLALVLESVVRDERYAVLTFQQDYRSNRLTSRGFKRLFVVRERGGWRIIAEEWNSASRGSSQTGTDPDALRSLDH